MAKRTILINATIDAAMAAGCGLLFVAIISAKPLQQRLSANYEARQEAWQAFRGERCDLTHTSTKWPGGLPVPRQVAEPTMVRKWQCDGARNYISFDSRVPVDWRDGLTVAPR